MKFKVKKNKSYSFCTCGLSNKIPICDNSHREFNLKNGTNYKSLKIKLGEDLAIEIDSSTWKKN